MDGMTAILFVLTITALFVIGGKIAFHFKNRELAMMKERFDREIEDTRQQHEVIRTTLSGDLLTQVKRTEEAYRRKLDEKDEQIQTLVTELEGMKAWKEDIGLKLAEFKGAAQGNPQMLIFKLLEHNQKLNRALQSKWEAVEQRLTEHLDGTTRELRKLFAEAEELHRDGLEIISIYESRLPDEIKRKVHQDLLQNAADSRVPLLEE